MLQDFRHPDIGNLEFDFYFPQYKLAFEYQVQSLNLQENNKNKGNSTL